MARALPKALLGFLSTAVFFAAFFLAGDILIAAFAAFLVVIAQFVLSRSAKVNPGLSIWASLAIVIALTGLSLQGEDTFAAMEATQANTAQPNCHCSALKPADPARAMRVPFREAPKGLAPAGRSV
jgi:thiol:disulfide interchange protein